MGQEIVKLTPQLEFMLIATMKIALDWRKSRQDKEEFLKWCSEVWDTIDLNGAEMIEESLNKRMQADLERYRTTGKIR